MLRIYNVSRSYMLKPGADNLFNASLQFINRYQFVLNYSICYGYYVTDTKQKFSCVSLIKLASILRVILSSSSAQVLEPFGRRCMYAENFHCTNLSKSLHFINRPYPVNHNPLHIIFDYLS